MSLPFVSRAAGALFGAALLLFDTPCARAQATADRDSVAPSAARATAPLRVFLDCPPDTDGCALDYFVVELPFADWTRDRQFADVHLLVNALETGSGGDAWTVAFIGRGRFAGRTDTLTTTTLPNASEDDVRRALADLFVRGLYPFVQRTPAAAQFTVRYTKPTGVAIKSPQVVRDPWSFWTIETSLDLALNGEQQQRFTNIGAEVEARRITDRWKVVAAVETEYNESRYTLRDSVDAATTFANVIRKEGARVRAVHAVTAHWSAGVVGSARRSDFLNTRRALRGGPVVELNVFPWREATRRQLTASYAIVANDFRYLEPTVFGRLAERRASQVLTLGTNVRQSWGSLYLTGRGAQFLHDPARYELSLAGSVRLQLVRGLSLTVEGEISRVRDQLYLPAASLSNEEILVRQRALPTGYQYATMVGLSYTFGSIFNTIVNPRLDSFRLLSTSGF